MTRDTLYDTTYEAIRAKILDGTFKPGSRLMQKEIASEFGLSHVPLREAIRKLEGERLVVVSPRRGVTVSLLSAEDLTDLYRVRLALEPLAFRRAAESATPADLEAAQETLVQLARLVDDPIAFFRAHDEAVRANIDLAPGDVLCDIVHVVRERSRHLRYVYSQLPGEPERLLERRRKVVAAMVQHNAELVEQLARLHLIEGRDALLAWHAENGTVDR
jgi:DNA-binding GntR family transcriptional regulator